MRAHFVIDASIAAKWVLPEPGSDEAGKVLERPDSVFHAPELCIAEVSNTLWKRVRRGEATRADAMRAMSLVQDLPLHHWSHQPIATNALTIALARGVSVYDALYVALAASLDAVLITADRKLGTAASEAGVTVEIL